MYLYISYELLMYEVWLTSAEYSLVSADMLHVLYLWYNHDMLNTLAHSTADELPARSIHA
jgi:hypothetical protein